MRKGVWRITALFLAASLALTSCGSKMIATTMALSKTEGTVDVHDGKQKEIEPIERLHLYSGYQVETHPVSYAWIDLDKVKLTKMDAESKIEIKKRKNDLEIMVNSGKLFFHITEPLKDEENLNIRTSSMIVGIRGTCGWVEVMEEKRMRVYVLEGTVACRRDKSGMAETISSPETSEGKSSLQDLLRQVLVRIIQPGREKEEETSTSDRSENRQLSKGEPAADGEKRVVDGQGPAADSEKAFVDEHVFYVECMGEDEEIYVSGGKMAELTYSPEGEEQIVLTEFKVSDIPDYVMEELLEDEELLQKIAEESGLDIEGGASEENQQENPEESNRIEENREVAGFLKNMVYYGDADACRLTPAQAEAFAQMIQEMLDRDMAYYQEQITTGYFSGMQGLRFLSRAALFDAGNGIPGVFYSCGIYNGLYDDVLSGAQDIGWEMVIEQVVLYLEDGDEVYTSALEKLCLGDGYLFGGGTWGDGLGYDGYVYPLDNGRMRNASTMASAYYEDQTYSVDGNPATKEEFDLWVSRWQVESEVGYSHANDISGSCWGMVPAEEVLSELNWYAQSAHDE